MKKLCKILLLTIVFAASLAGCNAFSAPPLPPPESAIKPGAPEQPMIPTEQTQEQPRELIAEAVPLEEFETWMSQYVDMQCYTVSSGETALVYSLAEEYMTEYPLDYTIRIGESANITLPLEYDQLQALGWKIAVGFSQNEVLPSRYSNAVWRDSRDYKIVVSAGNVEKTPMLYKECLLFRVYLQLWGGVGGKLQALDAGPDFQILGSLDNNSNMTDFLTTLGDPTRITYNVEEQGLEYLELYFENRKSSFLQVRLTADGSCITELSYSKNPKTDVEE